MVTRLTGNRTWSGGRDAEGHRNYKLTCRVVCAPGDGPAAVLATAGLPLIGSQWVLNNENDPWAFCTPEVNITPVITGEANTAFDVEYNFSTKPWRRPQGNPVGNPLLEPPRISINFNKTTEEAWVDRFNRPITNSAWERLRGKQVEFDGGLVVVKIEQNLGILDLPTLTTCYQTVNGLTLWGMSPRTIKLSEASITESYYGAGLVYYQRSLTFEVNFKGWDRALLDEGTKVLFGRYVAAGGGFASGSGMGTGGGSPSPPPSGPPVFPAPPDPIMWQLLPVDSLGTMPDQNNPTHFVKHQDRWGNPSRVVLNGAGIPAGTLPATGRQFICIQANGPPPRNLTDGNYWVPITSPPYFAAYQVNYEWRRGDLIVDNINHSYVALRASPANEGWVPGNWFQLFTTSDTGVYSQTRSYLPGDYTLDNTGLSAGVVRVQKYNEADFVGLLGIPLNLVPIGFDMLTPEWVPPDPSATDVGSPDPLPGRSPPWNAPVPSAGTTAGGEAGG